MSLEDDAAQGGLATSSAPACSGYRRRYLNRRNLIAGLTIATAFPPSTADAEKSAVVVPPEWDAAPRLELWPQGVPGAGYDPLSLPADWPVNYTRNVARPELRVFFPARPNRQVLLSIPGGAYVFVSTKSEGVNVAARMTALGYTVFVLVYRLPGEGWAHRSDVPLQDAQRAMRVIRAYAQDHRLNADMVSVIGFSAGGHLAASLATGFEERLLEPRDAIDRIEARPHRVALVYPVISHRAGVGHAQSTLQLLGPSPGAALVQRRSPAEHVTATTPPMLLVHAFDDTVVPIENSIVMMQAMRAARRPIEAHFFARGGHGFGMGAADLPASAWPDIFSRWLMDKPSGGS